MMTNQRPIHAIVAGHLCLDLSPAFLGDGARKLQDIMIPGKLINVGEMNLSTGGAVSNTGISMVMLGLETRLMGKVGADDLGSIVRRILEQYGVTDGLIVDPSAGTSYSIVIAPPGVDRIFLHFTGTNDTFRADDLDFELISQAQLFHFGYPPLMRTMYEKDGTELVKIYRKVKESGTTTSLDLALPDPLSPAGQADWPRIFSRVLPWTDICLPSIEELLFMLDRPLFDRAKAAAGDQDIIQYMDLSILPKLAGRMLDMGAKIVVIKLGRFGFFVKTASREILSGIGSDQWRR
jgi:sugar/nucleoside kinase (ribokinase family)